MWSIVWMGVNLQNHSTWREGAGCEETLLKRKHLEVTCSMHAEQCFCGGLAHVACRFGARLTTRQQTSLWSTMVARSRTTMNIVAPHSPACSHMHHAPANHTRHACACPRSTAGTPHMPHFHPAPEPHRALEAQDQLTHALQSDCGTLGDPCKDRARLLPTCGAGRPPVGCAGGQSFQRSTQRTCCARSICVHRALAA
jgi:hypothetical protein